MTRARLHGLRSTPLGQIQRSPRAPDELARSAARPPKAAITAGRGDVILAAGAAVSGTIEDVATTESKAATPSPAFRGVLPVGAPPALPPRRINSSGATGQPAPAWRSVILGERLPLKGEPNMVALGEALHGFFAADRPGAAADRRIALARRLLTAWGVSALRAEDAMCAADRLWAHLRAEHAGGVWRREWPVICVTEGQVLSGRVDLVVELGDGVAIYDHKSFPGGRDRWAAEVEAHAPQLNSYAMALTAAMGCRVTRVAIHLPVAGALLMLGK